MVDNFGVVHNGEDTSCNASVIGNLLRLLVHELNNLIYL